MDSGSAMLTIVPVKGVMINDLWYETALRIGLFKPLPGLELDVES